jgi:hypothetical protein
MQDFWKTASQSPILMMPCPFWDRHPSPHFSKLLLLQIGIIGNRVAALRQEGFCGK